MLDSESSTYQTSPNNSHTFAIVVHCRSVDGDGADKLLRLSVYSNSFKKGVLGGRQEDRHGPRRSATSTTT